MSHWLPISDRKEIRARLIDRYVKAAGLRGVVCFSCGNASQALQARPDLYVVEVAPGGQLRPETWWGTAAIRRSWPDLLDGTSGHLPADLMVLLGAELRFRIGPLKAGQLYRVPTGSGEALVALALAYPDVRFRACYNVGPGTSYEAEAPLNGLVARLAEVDLGLD